MGKKFQKIHTSLKALWVPLQFITTYRDLRIVGILFEVDSTTVVH